MAQNTSASSVVAQSGDANRPTKLSDTLRPHFFTTFQNYCCGSKSSLTASSQTKELLPIPEKFKRDAEDLLTAINGRLVEDLIKLTEWTSVIPNIFFEPDNNFNIYRYLVDRIMLKTLKEAHIINWIPSLKLLYPIRTSGNGNCLLHAVLIAMVGVHDLDLYLRDRLVQFMNENKDLLKNHWRIERLKSDKAYGIHSEDSKLDSEWDELCDLVRYENPEDGKSVPQLQYLEAVHIFSISNMLRRPIIVLSEDIIRNKNGEAISPNDLFGIYLPILSQPRECVNEPIVLAYDQSHFCPLQTNDVRNGKASDNLLPLYPSIDHAYDQTLLPVRFLGNDVSVEQSNDLLHGYLRIHKTDFSFDSKSPSLSILCADLGSKNLAPQDNFFRLYYEYAKDFFEVQKPRAVEEEERNFRKQREVENYASQQISYDTSGRSYSSTSYPLINDFQSRNRNDQSYQSGSAYDSLANNGSYVPNGGGGLYFEKRQLQKPSSTAYSGYDNLRESSPRERNQNGTQIPIHFIQPSSSSTRLSLTDHGRRTYAADPCVLCDRPFDDALSTRICPECDDRIRHATPHYTVSSRPTTSRSRTTNMYLPAFNNNGITPRISPTPKTRAGRVIHCSRCKHPNLLHSELHNSNYYCSVCQAPIYSSY